MEKEIIIDLKVESGDAQKDIDKFNKSLKETETDIENVEKASDNSKKGFSGLSKGVKAFGLSLKAAGIGFVIAAFAGLANALSKNQKVMDALAIVTGTIGQVFTEVANVFVDVIENTASAREKFDALGRVLMSIITLAVTPLMAQFKAIQIAITAAQLAWEKSWFGGNDPEKIAELKGELKDLNQEFIQIGKDALKAGATIVNDFGEAIEEASNITTELYKGISKINTKEIQKSIEALEKMKKAADEARIVNQGLIEEYDSQAEAQRKIRDNDLISIEERIIANNNLKATLDEQKKLMLENVQTLIDTAQATYDLTGLEADNLALQEAKNEKKAVEAQIDGFMSEQESNRVALKKESLELDESIAEANAVRKKEERAFNAEMIENEVKRLKMIKDNLVAEKKAETERLEFKRDSYQAGTQAFIDANNELLDYQQANDQEQKKIDKDLGKAKEGQMKETLGNIATIVGKNSKFGKAIAIVQALQDTYAGANKALAQGGIFGFIGAAAVIAGGIANVKKIASSKSPKPPAGLGARDTGGEPTPSIPSSASASIPPEFSTVGASGTNQLANLLGNQPPVQAFVVSGDVTTAQELDRNIISSASIG